MTSSTSPSDSHLPGWALTLLAAGLAAWALSAGYTLRLNPELAFFRVGHQLKQSWITRLDTESPAPKVIVFGGSSCNTSLDAQGLLERHGLRVANLGLGAGMGPEVLARYALDRARPGDTVVAALEPELLQGAVDWEPMGRQFALAIGRSALLAQDGRVDWLSALLDLRPGGYHVITLFWKIVLQQPLYRYAPGEFRPGGWHAVAARREITGPATVAPRLSDDARRWLRELRRTGEQKGLRILYAMPWGYCPAEHLPQHQKDLARFLLGISEVMPVLKDPTFGADTHRAHFADTAWHPTPEAVAERLPALAERYATLTEWTPEELRTLSEGPPLAP